MFMNINNTQILDRKIYNRKISTLNCKETSRLSLGNNVEYIIYIEFLK